MEKYKEILSKIRENFTDDYYVDLTAEECCELSHALFKARRYDADKSRLKAITEEISDVLICIEHIKGIYNISDEDIAKTVEYKINRTVDRIDKNEA